MALVIHSESRRSIPAINAGKQSNLLVDPSWDLIDPNPNVHALFLQFNNEYFEGMLASCEVKWSPRMTLCAGLCCYEGRGGLCSIRLSQPLLQYRPRKDMVETLLHEMIHAYLFVTQNNRDREGHGPEFLQIMYRINKIAGTNITVYHTFHAEVAELKKHWWRCEGVCRNRSPYFGWVKRSMNRAPGSTDFWFEEHQRSCGGVFVKVKEPEGFQSKIGSAKSISKISVSRFKNADMKNGKIRTNAGLENVRVSTASLTTTKTLDDYFSNLPGSGYSLESSAVNSTKTEHAKVSLPLAHDCNVQCPVCNVIVAEECINSHLDTCVSK